MNPNKAYTWRRGTRKKAKAMGFWPFSKAASATAPTLATLLETGTTSTGSYAPRTMRSLAQQGYLANPTVFRAVNIIAQTTASIPLQVFQTGKKRVKLESHPLLSQLNKPNEEQTRASFIEKLVSYWLIAGTAYIFGSFSSPRRPPAGLFPLRPDLTEMVLNSDNSINHYTYAVGSTIYTYIPWQVRPIRSFHPLDDFYGASPLSVAWAVIERQNEGELWNYSLIKHAARPSGAFVSSVNLSDISRLTLKREIDEKYRGAKKAGTPLLLEGGLSYVQLSLSPTDMDWIQADAGASRKLAMAIGVDPLLLNDKEHSTYNNVKEARLALIDITSLPLLSRFVDELNVWLAPYYGSDIEIAIDEDYLARLRDDKQTSSSIAINGFNAGTHTLNEARAIQGLDVLDDGDFMKLGPQIYVRISEIADFLTQQAERRAAAPVAPPQIAPPKTPPQKIDALLSRLEQKATHDESQESYIRQIEDRRASLTPAVQDSLSHFFRNQHTRVLAAIKTVKSIEQAKAVASTTIDSMTTELFDIFLLHYTAISSSFAEYTGQLLKTHTTIFTKEVAQDFLKQAEAAVESIQNTTKKRVERIIEEGRKHVNVKDFDGYDWVCSDLDDIFAGFLEERAEDIADQVVCDASNLGNYWAARNTGLPLKHTWLATLDEKTREDHRTASGQTQYLEMPYEVGYDHWMLFPGDKSYSAPISEWANCRCTEWYALDEAPQDNPYYQERLRQREVAGKSRLPFLRWAKFNPYHDNLGRFAHTPAGLAPPGQPAIPGLDPWTDINVDAFAQPHLLPLGKKPGTYTEPFQPHEDVEPYPQDGSIYEKEQYLNHWQEREVANLEPEEEMALTAYTDGAYKRLNSMLREGDDLTDKSMYDSHDYEAICEGLDSFLERNTIEASMKVYRGIDGDTKMLFEEGKVYTDNGFVSTSIAREKAENFAGDEGGALLTVKIPKGQHGAFVEPWSENASEEEFILPRSQRFRILSYEPNEDAYDKITVELLPEGKTKNG